jgi:hypothetical protein
MSVYELADGESAFDDPVREAYSTLANELYDEEFDEALFELLTDARNMHQDHLASGYSSSDADRVVTQHFSELVREAGHELELRRQGPLPPGNSGCPLGRTWQETPGIRGRVRSQLQRDHRVL